MDLVIEEWWNKVIDDPTEKRFCRRVLSEFELKSRIISKNNGGWKSEKELRKHLKKAKGFCGFTEEGAGKILLSTSWGIKLYQVIYLTNDTSNKPVVVF